MSQELLQAISQDDKESLMALLSGSSIPTKINKPKIPLRFDINKPDERGLTALMHAVEHSRSDMVRILLQHGANPHIKDARDGFSALAKAIARGDLEITRILLEEDSIRHSPWILSNALCHAANECQPEIVNLLMSIYQAPCLPDRGEIPFMWAMNTLDPRTIQAFSTRLGNEEAIRMRDPELNTYLTRARKIKEYGDLLGLQGKIRIRYPNSKNYEYIDARSLLFPEALKLMISVINKYLDNSILHESTRAHFINIQNAIKIWDEHLKTGHYPPLSPTQALNIFPAGWQGHEAWIAELNQWLLVHDLTRHITGHESAIYSLNTSLLSQVSSPFRSTRTLDSANTLIQRLLANIDQKQLIAYSNGATPQSATKKCGAFNAILHAIESFLFLQKLQALVHTLEKDNHGGRSRLHDIGIYTRENAIQAALGYAHREYRRFLSTIRDEQILALIKDYQSSKNNNSPNPRTGDDHRIDCELLGEILASLGTSLHNKMKNNTDTSLPNPGSRERKRILWILNALEVLDRQDILDRLNADDIDLITPFIQQDLEAARMLVGSGASIGLALRKAAEENNLHGLDLLGEFDLKKALSETNEEGDNALIIAARLGHYDMAKRLLDLGAQPTAINRRTRETAISIAINAGDGCLVQLLTQQISPPSNRSKM